MVRQLSEVTAIEGAPHVEHGGFPLWHQGMFWWASITEHQVHCFDPRTGNLRSWRFDGAIGAIVPCDDGKLLIATQRGVHLFDPASGARRQIASAPYDMAHFQFNEGVVGPDGVPWFGTYSQGSQGMFYRFFKGAFQALLPGGGACNGLAWSPDGRTMYVADTRARAIYAYTVENGLPLIHTRRVFFDEFDPPARPDCASVDERGNYWVAVYEGGCVLCISPDGELLLRIDLLRLGVLFPTKVFFFGEGMRMLGITTSGLHLSADERDRHPLAGRMLQVEVDVAGLAVRAARL